MGRLDYFCAAAAGLIAIGCAGDPSGAKGRTKVAAPGDAAVAKVPPTTKAPPGAPHSGNLIEVTVDQAGAAALSLDEVGGVRFWPALDGSREPVLVRGSLANLDLLQVGDHWLGTGIDRAGSARVIRFEKDGTNLELLALPPNPRAIDSVILGDGTVAVLGEDRMVRMVREGKTIASYVERGYRPSQMRRHGDGSISLVAIEVGDKATTIDIRRVNTKKRTWTAMSTRELELAGVREAPKALRFSDDGSHLAAFSKELTTSKWRLWIANIGTGKVASIELIIPVNRSPGGAFVAANRFLATTHVHVGLTEVILGETLTTGANLPGPASHLLPVSINGGPFRIVAGAGQHLYTFDPRTHEQAYLGYESVVAGLQELSPSGKQIAWRNIRGHLVLYDASTRSATTIPNTEGSLQAVRFYGEDRIVAFYYPERLVMYDTETGKAVDEHAAANASSSEIRDDLMLVRASGQLLSLSKSGFSRIGLLTGLVSTSKLVQNEGEWAVLGRSQKDSKWRMVRIEQIRHGLGVEEFEALPTRESHGSQLDDIGRFYQRTNSTITRRRADGATTMTIELPRRLSGSLWPVPVPGSGKRIVAGGVNKTLLVFDGQTGQRLWAATDSIGQMSWSQDFSRALVASHGSLGIAIYDGKSGKPLHTVCGYDFRASKAPPPQRSSNSAGKPNICSR